LFGGGGHETYGAQQRMLADPNFDEHKHRDAVNALSPADLYAANQRRFFALFKAAKATSRNRVMSRSPARAASIIILAMTRGLMRYRLRPFEGRLRNR